MQGKPTKGIPDEDVLTFTIQQERNTVWRSMFGNDCQSTLLDRIAKTGRMEFASTQTKSAYAD